MIINLRGTNGSGKSTIVRDLMSRGELVRPHYSIQGPRKADCYEYRFDRVERSLFILGSYHATSGGCDQIQPYDIILDLIKKYAERGHVLFEGVLVSSSYGRVGRLMEEYPDAVMAFLDTPLEQCIENVKKRRTSRHDDRPFNPHNLTSKYNQIVKSRAGIEEEGRVKTIDIGTFTGAKTILKMLRRAS